MSIDVKQDFNFLNSEIWIKYTHEQYKTLDEIKYRLDQKSLNPKDWDELKTKIVRLRKTSAIPLFVNSLDKKFWFYPSDSLFKKTDKIEKLGQGLYQKILNQSDFAQDFILDASIEEAITSAIYEGANSTRAKAKELIESENLPKSKDEWMLYNNFKALQWIKKNQSVDINLDVIKELHHIVTQNTLLGDDINFVGKFRNDGVFVHSSRGEVKHEGVKHELVSEALTEVLQLTTHNARYFPNLFKGICLHYFIAYIHPFFDGNGRTARALFYFDSIKNDLKFIELLSVSAYLKSHGQQYEKSFEKVKDEDFDLTYFIDFNLDALLEALERISDKVEFLLSLNKLKAHLNISQNQVGLLQKLALHRFRKYDIESYAESIQKSREIARKELRQLADLGLLLESKVGKKYSYQIQIDHLNQKMTELSKS